ncbi:MAG: type IV secretory system conjugative DNA transfer family protein, partial [Phycisphaerae bacterium]
NWGGSRTSDTANPSTSSSWGGSSSTSYNEVGRSLLRPEEILQLPAHLAIVLLPNVRPIIAVKVPYFAKSNRRLSRRVFDLLSGVVTITVMTAVFVSVGWALTAGANDPRVLHFWRTSQAAFRF